MMRRMNQDARSQPGFAPRFAIAMAPLVEGFLLFFLLELINPLWSSLFGLGGHMVEWIAPPHGMGWIDLFGLLVWPVLLLAMLHWLSGRLLRLPGWTRGIALVAYCLSLLCVVPLDAVEGGDWGLDRLPLYFALWAY
jgi:hypothetical protein